MVKGIIIGIVFAAIAIYFLSPAVPSSNQVGDVYSLIGNPINPKDSIDSMGERLASSEAVSEAKQKLKQSYSEIAPSSQKEQDAERLVHKLVNEERKKYNLKPLQYDSELAQVAKSHSADMQEREFFSHVTPDGLTPTDRGGILGYECRYIKGMWLYEGIAENIHMAYGASTTWSTPESIAETAVNGWMNSPGHRENILNDHYEKEGIGVEIGLFTIHVTQNFC